MFDTLIKSLSSFGNKRSNSLSIPVFDGAYKPNNLLEEADVLVERVGLEDLASNSEGKLFAACGQAVYEVRSDGMLSEVASFEQGVTALAILDDDTLAVGLGNKVITGVGTALERSIEQAEGSPIMAVTALSAQADGQILICDGSDKYSCSEWSRDLMSKNKRGRLIQYSPASGEVKVLASGLSYAFGAFDDGQNDPLVSESWTHSVSRVSGSRVLDRLPGYPCRIAAADNGGFWLTLFCSRTQLVEFVLKENDYRREMMKTIDPEYWISPAFGSGRDFLEPLQSGGVKQMGILKPWAPPRSYGLVVRYNADLIPVFSLHSRVGSVNHGICAATQIGDTLYLLSKGAGRILKVSVSKTRATIFGKETI
ncbi:MAG: hypothetical protein QM488_09845 [Rhizobiaceae bacterium]